MIDRRHFLATAAAGTGLASFLGWPSAARAQAAPIETLKVLCGYPAGGTTDAVSRRVAEKLTGVTSSMRYDSVL